MTVGDDLHKTLTSLEGAKSNLESFALDTNDNKAEQLYNSCAQDLEQLTQQLEQRVNFVEQEEPQYKARQNNQNNQQQQ